jgi:hypothetical protein
MSVFVKEEGFYTMSMYVAPFNNPTIAMNNITAKLAIVNTFPKWSMDAYVYITYI